MTVFPFAPLLAFLALTPATAAPVDPIPEVAISVADGRILPATIRLAADVPVRLSFANPGDAEQRFVARPFFANARVLSGEMPDGVVVLPAHARRSITLVAMRGTYPATSDDRDHRRTTARSTIVVE